jgi:hypothetical protein
VNIGTDQWAVTMDDVQYSNMGLGNGNSVGGKMAIIDSGNTSI